MSVKVTSDSSFTRDVLESETPVVVDFWAPWCGPCKLISPLLEKVAAEFEGKVQVRTLNLDDNPITAPAYRIRSIPTLMVFKNGKVIDTHIGSATADKIRSLFANALSRTHSVA